ncbi:3-methyl-2-oxobutanoate dehydrogenase subunit VorB [Candidatus Fermentibacteria bacterium]|nr:3-methyl-2-oxobutanoate dehydrogenase subunit VorB [Candidatus Fermentibacteria bacterium]
MAKQFIKGNEAVVKGAILAGCQAYYGYPITPASEIAEAAAYYLPLLGRTFLQAESEIGAINMVYGAASAGIRVMTASSSPGISLKQEGISYAAGAELSCVVVDITRGGPGLGNIAPEQSDYNQMVKGGGHGNYKLIVLAPNCAQEMCDLTMHAFDLADRYRTPVVVMADGFVGQMMEPVEFPAPVVDLPPKPWATAGTPETYKNLITSIDLEPDDLERHINHLYAKYAEIEANEVRYEEYMVDDADLVCIGFGVVSRILQSGIERVRAEGKKVGLLRPITLWPFPEKRLARLADEGKKLLVMEMNKGMMVDDVRLAVQHRVPVGFYGRVGGNVPSGREVYDQIMLHLEAV